MTNPVDKPLRRLTDREWQVLRLTCKGLSAKSIASVLQLKQGTVDFHRDSLYKKFGVVGLNALVGFAVKNGYIGIAEL